MIELDKYKDKNPFGITNDEIDHLVNNSTEPSSNIMTSAPPYADWLCGLPLQLPFLVLCS